MPQLLIRNLEPETVDALKQRARNNHRSLQAEAQLILEKAAAVQANDFWANSQKIRKTVQQNKQQTFSDSTVLIREDRDS